MANLFQRGALALSAILVALFTTAASAQTPPPAEAFQWQIRDIEVSPDGQYLSMLQPLDGRVGLAIYNLAGGAPTVIEPGQRLQGEYMTITNHFWSGDRVVVEAEWNFHYQSSRANFRTKQTRMFSANPDGSGVQVLFESSQNDNANRPQRENDVVDVLPNEPNYILVAKYDVVENVGFRNVHRVNIRNGRTTRAAQGTGDTISFATNSNGDVVARLDSDEGQLRLMTREPGSLSWNVLYRVGEFEGDGQANVSPLAVVDGLLYVRSNHEGRNGIYSIDMDSPAGMQRVFLHDEVDVGGLSISTQEDRILSVSYNTTYGPEWHFFDEEEESFHNRINRLLPGEWENVVESSDDENLHVISSWGPGDPTVYYLMNMSAGTISEIGQAYPDLAPDMLGDVSVVTYEARDGLEISGYLVLPPGASAEDGPFPFVLYPHGGPNARDYIDFDFLRQFIATRGYAVFAPNFRGSRGFGDEFMAAGFGEFGGTMQDDLVDGTQHLIDIGIADPNRTCIVGWSYSAYAALYAAADTPEMFNCAVGVNGVYDLPRMIGDLTTGRAWSSIRFWRNSMGNDDARLAQVSPNRLVDQITIPVLIIASEEDHIVPFEESTRIIGSLRRAGRSYESEIYEYGDHSMNYRPNMIGTFNHIERFLDQHM